MAKKKKQYPNKTKQTIRNGAIALGVIAVAAGGVLAGVLANNAGKSWVMKFDGQKISAEYLRYFAVNAEINAASGGSSGSGDYVADGYSYLQSYQVYEKTAAQLGLARTEEDLATGRETLANYKSTMESYGLAVPKLKDDELVQLLSADALTTKLYDHYTAGYTVDEADFATQFDDYYATGKVYWADPQVKYIFQEDEETIDMAVQALADDMDFDQAMELYSADYNEENGPQTIALKDLYPDEETQAAVFALEPGQHTGKVVWGEESSGVYYLIFQLESIASPTKEEVQATFREDSYIPAKKNEMFNSVMTDLAAESAIEKNDKGYDAFAATWQS